ncbi:MAG: hypothetical protein HY897_14505 [Deltaproteobacteria bacterium]|nr:hypothetical protein [Deltaproteobacteria bacterium]
MLAMTAAAVVTFAFAAPAWAVARSWIGAGAGGAGTDFNTGTNWNPNGIPTSADDLTMTITATAYVTLSADITVGSLTISLSGNAKAFELDAQTYIFTINGATSANITSGNNSQIYIDVGNSPGRINYNGNVTAGAASANSFAAPICTYSGQTTGTVTFRADLTFNASGGTCANTYKPATVIFDGTGTQTVTDNDNNWMKYFGYSSTLIGSANTPTAVWAGTTTGGTQISGDLTVNANSTLDLTTKTLNRSAAGGTLALNAGAAMKLAAGSGGQTGSNFPSNFTTFTLNAASTVEYNGTVAQTVFATPTYGNLTVANNSTKTAGNALTVAGNVLINPTATFDVSASNFALSVGGNWTNDGTFNARSGTATFNATAAKTIGGSQDTTFFNLTHTTSGDIKFGDATTGGRTFTIAGTFNWSGSNLIIGNSAAPALSDTLALPGSLTIPATFALTMYNSSTLKLKGDWTNSGTFNAGTGTVEFNGSGTDLSPQTINGSLTTFYRVVVSNNSTVKLNVDANFQSELVPTAGQFYLPATTSSWINVP